MQNRTTSLSVLSEAIPLTEVQTKMVLLMLRSDLVSGDGEWRLLSLSDLVTVMDSKNGTFDGMDEAVTSLHQMNVINLDGETDLRIKILFTHRMDIRSDCLSFQFDQGFLRFLEETSRRENIKSF